MTDKKPTYKTPAKHNHRLMRDPREDLRIEIDFGYDINSVDFELHYDPKRWPAGNNTLNEGPEGMWDMDSGYLTVHQNKTLRIKIPHSEIKDWKRQTIYLTLIADDGTDRWEVDTFTVTSQTTA